MSAPVEAARPAPSPGRLLTVPVHRVAFSLGHIHLVEAAPHTHPLDVHQLLHLAPVPGNARTEAADAVLGVVLRGAGRRPRGGGRAAHMVAVRVLRPGPGPGGLRQGSEGELDAERVVADEGLPGLLVLLVEPAHLLRAQLRHDLVAVPGGRAAKPGTLPLPGPPSGRPAAPRVRRDQRRLLRRVQRRGAAAATTLALAVVAQRGARLGRAEVIVLVTEAGVQRQVVVVVLRSRRQMQSGLPAQQGQGHLVVARVPGGQVVEAADAAAERRLRIRAQLPSSGTAAAAPAVMLGVSGRPVARVIHAVEMQPAARPGAEPWPTALPPHI